jgi:hypothetical protein
VKEVRKAFLMQHVCAAGRYIWKCMRKNQDYVVRSTLPTVLLQWQLHISEFNWCMKNWDYHSYPDSNFGTLSVILLECN